MESPLLEYDHVEVSYNGIPTLHDICLKVLPGEVVSVVGESGSGKSTLIKAAMGQLGPSGIVTRGDTCPRRGCASCAAVTWRFSFRIALRP